MVKSMAFEGVLQNRAHVLATKVAETLWLFYPFTAPAVSPAMNQR